MLKLFKNPLAITIFTIITIVFYISLSKTQQKTLDTTQKLITVQTEKEQLKEENKNLEEKLQDNDAEQIIRDEFLMQKNGEYVVKVPSLPEENSIETKKTNKSNLEKWKELLLF